MKLSICICTRDRPALLNQALASLADLESPGVQWEVLVVDNGSRPSLPALLGESFPGLALRVVAEPRGGLSCARNTAIAESRGEGLVFIDDDVTVPPAWLRAYALGFERYPDAAFFGGPILPRITEAAFEAKLRTIERVMPGVVSLLNPDQQEGPLPTDADILPWGANMAVRRSAVGDLRFNLRRGRRPEAPLASGEETELFQQLLAAGAHGVWLPAAGLDHNVEPQRCTGRYLKRYAHGIGWLVGRQEALERHESPDSWRGWVAGEHRSRWCAKWTTPPWAPLQDRWAALRDLATIEGMRAGFEETLKELERAPSR